MSTIFALAVITLSVTAMIGFNERFSHAQETIDVTNPTLPSQEVPTEFDVKDHIPFYIITIPSDGLVSSPTQGIILFSNGDPLCTLSMPHNTAYIIFAETVTVNHDRTCVPNHAHQRFVELQGDQNETFHQGDILVLYRHDLTDKDEWIEVYREQTIHG